MRIQFSGALVTLQPVVLSWAETYSFEKGPYVVAGYTTFDVICIGGGGGKGGGTEGPDTNNSSIYLVSYGGEGGGGAFHRVRGLLSVLPDIVPVQVGGAGANGLDGDLGENTDGSEGGPSQFGDLAAASGGRGGLRVFTRSIVDPPGSDGGEGGVGGTIFTGGGAEGGLAGQLGPFVAGTPGVDGTLISGVGGGGGGGAGGVGKMGGVTQLPATTGGRGAYDPSDPSVYGPAGAIGNDPISGAQGIVPGKASGARITPFDGSNRVYGQSGMPGFVAIRLTADT